MESISPPNQNRVQLIGEAARKRIDDARDGTTARGLIPTGVVGLDERFGMMSAGTLTTLAAKTSIGKTQFALQILQACSRRGIPSLILSLEMSAGKLSDRYLCELAQIDPKTFRQEPSNLLDADWERLEASAETLANWPLTVWDAANVSIPQLKAMARVWKSQSVKDRGLIVVDYLQLLTTNTGNESRANKVSALARGTKSIAHDLQLPLLQLSQLNRQVTENEPPNLNHLKESGGVEENSDNVWFLHRPNFVVNGVRTTQEVEEAQVIVAKMRNSSLGVVNVEYRPGIGFMDPMPARYSEFDAFNNGNL